MLNLIVDLLQLLEVEHEGGVSHQFLGCLDGVILVTREDIEHPADNSDNLLGLQLGRGDVLGLLNQPTSKQKNKLISLLCISTENLPKLRIIKLILSITIGLCFLK